jgi:phage-related protein
MIIPADCYYEFNGTVLNTLAYNIETYPESLPARRGDNLEIPFLDGRRFVQKHFEQRVITLNMWVRGRDTDGNPVAGKSERRALEENTETLKRLFGAPRAQVPFRYKLKDGATYRKALVEIVNVVEFAKEMSGGVARFSVDLLLADPFFYAESYTTDTQSITATPTEWIHTNPGTAPAKKMTIKFSGSLVNPKLENVSAGIWVQYNATIAGGETVTIDTENFTVLKGSTNMISVLKHQGDPAWFLLDPGGNLLKVTCDSAPSGSVEIKYYAPYF